MKDWWVRFGCFLTGYNYNIVRNSSEISVKAVKRYTSALLIISILWSFIGYSFTSRYLHGDFLGSIIGAVLFVIIIIQIERQIILSINPSWWLYFFRGVIALMMALIGAIIIDQIIFKEDIELEKITFIEKRVEKALVPKTLDLKSHISSLETAILTKEQERQGLILDISKNPTTIVYSTQSSIKSEKITTIDALTNKPTISEKSVPVSVTTSTNVANPKISLIDPLEQTIKILRDQKSQNEAALLNIRPELEKEIGSKTGFLDELEVMYSLISGSKVALLIWMIWFVFLLGLEMLVLISKINEKENDYERTVQHQMDLQLKKLELFAKLSDKEIK